MLSAGGGLLFGVDGRVGPLGGDADGGGRRARGSTQRRLEDRPTDKRGAIDGSPKHDSQLLRAGNHVIADDQDSELVAPDTGDRCSGGHGTEQRGSGGGDESVSRGMPKGVVGQFQIVEIEQRHRRPTTWHLSHVTLGGLERLLPCSPVAHCGQGVGAGLFFGLDDRLAQRQGAAHLNPTVIRQQPGQQNRARQQDKTGQPMVLGGQHGRQPDRGEQRIGRETPGHRPDDVAQRNAKPPGAYGTGNRIDGELGPKSDEVDRPVIQVGSTSVPQHQDRADAVPAGARPHEQRAPERAGLTISTAGGHEQRDQHRQWHQLAGQQKQHSDEHWTRWYGAARGRFELGVKRHGVQRDQHDQGDDVGTTDRPRTRGDRQGDGGVTAAEGNGRQTVANRNSSATAIPAICEFLRFGPIITAACAYLSLHGSTMTSSTSQTAGLFAGMISMVTVCCPFASRTLGMLMRGDGPHPKLSPDIV